MKKLQLFFSILEQCGTTCIKMSRQCCLGKPGGWLRRYTANLQGVSTSSQGAGASRQGVATVSSGGVSEETPRAEKTQ